jgi:serine/threonine protein kinase
MMTQCLNPNCLKQNRAENQFCEKCGGKLRLRDRYRALSMIGQGNFGRTFKACDEDKPSKPFCVIKQFLPQVQGTANQQKAAELFDLEAKRLETLGSHRQIPELFAYFTQEGRQYLVQEFIDGENLQKELDRNVFTEEQIKELLADLLPVLQFCHEKQVIHRDIKPENIIRRNSDRALVLVDFGAAKFVTDPSLSVGTAIGSPGYQSPEQFLGKATFASDIYSLGATCIHLLTGVNPCDLFDANEDRLLWRDRLPEAISDELAQILDKMLQRSLARRYQSAREVLAALNFLISAEGDVPLESAKGIDYTHLRDLLQAGKWQKADEETAKKMLETMSREYFLFFIPFLTRKDIENFPCQDLRTIDRLWVKYSEGRFGFSVQARILEELGGAGKEYDRQIWEQFGDRVGWRKEGRWLKYQDIAFNNTAPSGHLPVGGAGLRRLTAEWFGTGFFVERFSPLVRRLAVCKIS